MISATSNFLAANAQKAKRPVLALEIDGYARIFTTRDTGISGHYHWITSIDDLGTDCSDLDGSSSLSDLNVYVLDFGRAITGDLGGSPNIILEGRTARLKTGFVGLAYADYTTLFTGIVLSVPMADNDNVYLITLHDARQDVSKVIYDIGDDGQPTGSDHPRTVVGNPMDILLDVLLTQLALPAGNVDSTKIQAYRDQVFAGMEFEFELTTAPDAKEFCEKQIMKPLGGYLRTTADGKITVQFFTPLPGTNTPVATLDEHVLVNLPVPEQADLVNVVSVRFDTDGKNNYLSEAVNIDSDSETKYGQQGQNIIESDGLRSAFQGFMIAAQTAQAIFSRYGDKNPTFGNSSTGASNPLEVFWSLCLLEQGDLVYVSHPLIPDRKTGTVGWVNKPFEVLKRNWKFSGQYTVELTLVDGSGAVAGGAFKITTDGEAVWTSASPTDQATLMFISGSNGKYSDGKPGNVYA